MQEEQRAPFPCHPDHLRHGYPGIGTTVYHRGGGAVRPGGDQQQGQAALCIFAGEIAAAPAELCQRAKKDRRGGIYHPDGQAVRPKQYLAGYESVVCKCSCRAGEGIPPQPAAPLCPYFLLVGKRFEPPCGHFRSFQHRHYPYLHRRERCCSCPTNRKVGTCDNIICVLL